MFFGVVNSSAYYPIDKNVFELPYEEVIRYSKKFNFYNKTMHKLLQLFQENNTTEEFYIGLLH